MSGLRKGVCGIAKGDGKHGESRVIANYFVQLLVFIHARSHRLCFYHGDKEEPTTLFWVKVIYLSLNRLPALRTFPLGNKSLIPQDGPGYSESVSALPCVGTWTFFLGLHPCQEAHTLHISFRHSQKLR